MSTCICGGEPMLRKDAVFEYIRILKSGDIIVNMVSNGYFISDEVASKLHDLKINNVQISVDGFEENHDWLRNKKGSFEKAINAINHLISNGCEVNVACTPTTKNINEIESLVGYLADLGISGFRMQPIMPMGRAITLDEFYPTQMQYIKLSRIISKLRSMYPKVYFEWGDPSGHLALVKEGVWNKLITVSPYGDVLLSPYLPISFGNVLRHTLEEYLDAGLDEIGKIEPITQLSDLISNTENIDVSKNTKMPALYTSDLFRMDILDDNIDEKINELKKLIG